MKQRVLALAQQIQEKIQNNISSKEQQFHHKMQKLLLNPKNKVMLIELLDRSFRCKDKHASFMLISHTLQKYGIADFFNHFEKFLLVCFLNLGKFAPNISVPFFIHRLREDTKTMVLDSHIMQSHIIKRRQDDNITLNINLIGEEVLGEAESAFRMQKYQEAIRSPYISYISIKITTIFSQINIIDFEYSKNEIVKRLDTLYTLALQEEQKQNVSKFINLDMEEFRDLELTVEAFMESIAKFNLKAGIVLQAYIPDSFSYLKKLFAFSKKRVLQGLPPIKIRFVKGANMESEETIASQKGWELPTFNKKVDTDSNYKKMLDFILQNDNYKYINIGIASHNIFEIAYAFICAETANALPSFSFEMLEGMSLTCSYEVSKMHNLILYAPVCEAKHFNNAIAYLVRRLDENTSADNFMRYFFNLKVNDTNYNAQKKLFLDSLKGIKTLDNSTRRTQNRLKPPKFQSSYKTKTFTNESDTDFILPKNRLWAKKICEKYQNLSDINVAPVIGHREDYTQLECLKIQDKIHSRDIGKVYLANQSQIKVALEVAQASKFPVKSHNDIYQILSKVAKIIRQRRGDLIGIAALEVGKTFAEVDSEISEAIDFLEFYPYSLDVLKKQNPNTIFTPKGVGVVIAPWNFPIGISAGTIAAPLSAGNPIIYKPSSLSTLTGYMLCQCFWDAGIPKDALIFLPAKGKDISAFLLKSSAIKFAILTGGEDTAQKMLEANPTLLLSAETGGKNATIVSKFADRDLAVKNIIQSAFSNSGQKCSATSLLILEEEVYDDIEFKRTLVDAARSLLVGSPFMLKNKLGALADKPSEKVLKAINELKDYEEWALKPRFINDNPYLMTPGIKYGTLMGDFTHCNELFAPILSVMKAKNLQEAIEIVKATGYGLTAGLESLDEREWEYFHTHIEAGNIYINKPTTGAIVLRQPFGGIKKSAIGFGRKVGAYNYITQFMDIVSPKAEKLSLKSDYAQMLSDILNSSTQKYSKLQSFGVSLTGYKKAIKQAIAMAKSYIYHQKHEFTQSKDYVNIRGEDNLFSYTAIKNMAYRVYKDDDLADILGVMLGGAITKVPVVCSYSPYHEKNYSKNKGDSEKIKIANTIALAKALNEILGLNCVFIEQDEETFISYIPSFERIRYFAPADMDDRIYKTAAQNAIIIARNRPILNGRFELLLYYNEKSLSISFHRYGNLGIRGLQNQKNKI